MVKFVSIGRVEECSPKNEEKEEKEEKKVWKLLNTVKLTANSSNILVNKDLDGNEFCCEEIIIVGKVVSNATSKPMCRINNAIEFSGINSTFINGTRYIYDTYKIRGFFIERDMRYLNQNILENAVLFDDGFKRIIKQSVDGIKSIEFYSDATTFTFKSGTELEIYGF